MITLSNVGNNFFSRVFVQHAAVCDVRRAAMCDIRRAGLFFPSFLSIFEVVVVISLFHLVLCGSLLMKAVGFMWINPSELAFGFVTDFG